MHAASDLLASQTETLNNPRMLLAVDIGNSGIAFGVFEKRKLVAQFQAESARNRTSDEHAVMLSEVLHLRDITREQVTSAIIASVVPTVTDAVSRAIGQCFNVQPVVVGPYTNTGITVRYENVNDVGADRIVNAVAARHKANGGAIIVDLSTATIVDCVSPDGDYLGGCIAPGIQVSADALVSKASKLHRVDLVAPPKAVGRNSATAMQAGIVLGHAGLVTGLVERMKREAGFSCRVIGTGPLFHVLAPHLKCIDEVHETLTIEGLQLVADRLAQEATKTSRKTGRTVPSKK